MKLEMKTETETDPGYMADVARIEADRIRQNNERKARNRLAREKNALLRASRAGEQNRRVENVLV